MGHSLRGQVSGSTFSFPVRVPPKRSAPFVSGLPGFLWVPVFCSSSVCRTVCSVCGCFTATAPVVAPIERGIRGAVHSATMAPRRPIRPVPPTGRAFEICAHPTPPSGKCPPTTTLSTAFACAKVPGLQQRARDGVAPLHASAPGPPVCTASRQPGTTGGLEHLNAFFLLTAAPETCILPAAPTRDVAPSLAAGISLIAAFALAALAIFARRA